jgi:hypothetical protein
MESAIKLPQVGEEFYIHTPDLAPNEFRTVVVLSVAKRGRGHQVLTDHGRFRLKDFNAMITEPANV